MPGTQERVWSLVAPLFAESDSGGALPEIRLDFVPPGAMRSIWDRLILDASFVDPDAEVREIATGHARSARAVENLAELAEQGMLDVHLVLRNVARGWVTLPDLGVSLWPGVVALDYKMNEWDAETAEAFLRLLVDIQSLAPGSALTPADEAGHPVASSLQRRFEEAISILRP